MGTIDKLWVKVACERCKISEVSYAVDRGTFKGSNWNTPGSFEKFDVTYKGGREEEPAVTLAKCRKCGADASVKKGYGPEKPKDL